MGVPAIVVDNTSAPLLVLYERAKAALAEARATDEIKMIHDQVRAIAAAAKVAKDRQLEMDATELRIRAERRLGEMIEAQKATVGLNRGALVGGTSREPPRDDRPTLADAGIDKRLSSRAQQLARIPDDAFDEMVEEWRVRINVEDARITSDLLASYKALTIVDPQRDHRPESAKCGPPVAPTTEHPTKWPELVWMLIQRRHALGIPQAELDERAGWPEGQASKYEIPHADDGRIPSFPAMFEWLTALGLSIKLVAV